MIATTPEDLHVQRPHQVLLVPDLVGVGRLSYITKDSVALVARGLFLPLGSRAYTDQSWSSCSVLEAKRS